jgi:cytoskeletal protein CcmA (bactofilin family)
VKQPPQANKEPEMFGKSKDGNDPMLPPLKQPSGDQPSMDQVSAISRGITVVGRIFGEGTVEIFGRIEGELRASTVSIQEGAQVEGDVVAEDLIIAGQVKGTIHANSVKLNSTAVVEGDIFHRLLSIEENARFDGTSKREDKAVDLPHILLRTPAVQDRDNEAIDLPRIPLRATAVQDNFQVKVDVIEGKPKSTGHLALADSPSLAPR